MLIEEHYLYKTYYELTYSRTTLKCGKQKELTIVINNSTYSMILDNNGYLTFDAHGYERYSGSFPVYDIDITVDKLGNEITYYNVGSDGDSHGWVPSQLINDMAYFILSNNKSFSEGSINTFDKDNKYNNALHDMTTPAIVPYGERIYIRRGSGSYDGSFWLESDGTISDATHGIHIGKVKNNLLGNKFVPVGDEGLDFQYQLLNNYEQMKELGELYNSYSDLWGSEYGIPIPWCLKTIKPYGDIV
ncbi:hypothetical protein Ecwhy1_540 [Escherichia phage Ecwhy_1]|nr:hypothetical protein Ecwhy1_540 [Escherichia phage Ecwhy_1]